MFGWHHCLNGHESEQTPGDSEGQGGLACRRPWGHKELYMNWRLNNKDTSHIGLSVHPPPSMTSS